MTTHGPASSRTCRLLVALACAGTLLAMPALADEPLMRRVTPERGADFAGTRAVLRPHLGRLTSISIRNATTSHPRLTAPVAGPEEGFLGRHLAPRLERQIGQVIPIHSLESQRSHFETSTLHDRIMVSAEQCAERGTRRAVRDYLLEETGLETLVDSIRGRRQGPAIPEPGPYRATDFDLGISGGRLRFDMEHQSNAGTTRLRLALDGDVNIAFVPAGAPKAAVFAAFDRSSSRIDLAFRQSF